MAAQGPSQMSVALCYPLPMLTHQQGTPCPKELIANAINTEVSY